MKASAFLLICLLSFSTLSAQDTHYWTHQFGPHSTLLGGSSAMVVKDNSAIINNPGSLGLSSSGGISITTNAYAMSNSKFNDGAGEGLDMRSRKLHSIPLIISAAYKHKKYPKWTVGYAILDKTRYKFEATQRFDGVVNVLYEDYSAGSEEFVSQIDVNTNLGETWAGGCVSYRINDNLSIGLTEFIAYRDHQFSYNTIGRAIVNDPIYIEAATSSYLYHVSYSSFRSITKLGLSASFESINAGITFTLPSFNIRSNATVNSDIAGNNVIVDDIDTIRGDFVANDRQTDLKANYRSPWSVAVGLSKAFHKTTVYFTAEYFGPVQQYIYISPRREAFIRPLGVGIDDTRDALLVAGGKRPVFNAAIGVERILFDNYSLLMGVRTDNSYYDVSAEDIGNSLSLTDANLYHGSLGVSIQRSKSDLYLGVSASYGSNTTAQLANISDPGDNIYLEGDIYNSEYRYYGLALIVGYIYYLK